MKRHTSGPQHAFRTNTQQHGKKTEAAKGRYVREKPITGKEQMAQGSEVTGVRTNSRL